VAQDPTTMLLKGRYRLGALLGQGGLAAVYRATDETLGRDVAVKVFRENAVDEHEFRKQEAEVSLLASLNHPSVVTLLDAAVDRGRGDTTRIYYVMELVEGTDLRERLESGALPPRQVAQVGHDIAEALEYLHLQGLVHRDVKPGNILLGDYVDDGARVRAKVTDLGIATFGATQELGADQVVTGTVAYLSPEQASGRAVDAATDIYSLGLVLIESLSGQMAFPGPPEHSALARLIEDPRLPEHAGEDWHDLLAAMTAREPSDRPSAKDVVLALRDRLAAESGKHALAPAEAARLDAASRFEHAAGGGEANFERITAMAAAALGAPVAVLSVIEGDRVLFSTAHGLDRSSPDASLLHDPVTAGALGFGFHASVPLETGNGYIIGALCVLDVVPREVRAEYLTSLQDLAGVVLRYLEPAIEEQLIAD
jgi:tRNA A-37 threonylcarbamoyl transferase component Bud32